MPIDHNIIGQLRPLRVESPVNALGQVMQLQGMQQRNQMNGLQMQQAQQEMQAQNALAQERAAFNRQLGEADFSTPEGQNALIRRFPQLAPGFVKSQLELDEKRGNIKRTTAQTGKEEVETGVKALAARRDMLSMVQSPEQMAQWIDGMYADPNTARIAQSMGAPDAMKARIPTDPAKFAEFLQQNAMGMDKFIQAQTQRASQAEAARHNRVSEGISAGNLSLSRQRLALDQSAPKGTYDPARGVIVDTRSGTASPVTLPGGAPLPASKPVNMSATMQKEVFEADDTVQSGKAVINILEQASKLNDTAYSGYLAKPRAVLRSNLPGQSPEADATINLDNMMTGQALESLKLVFGGMPTEGERKILLEMQASADKTPGQRKDIIQRAIKAAKTRVAFNEKKGKALREGTYMTQGVQNDPVPPDAPASPAGAKFLGFE